MEEFNSKLEEFVAPAGKYRINTPDGDVMEVSLSGDNEKDIAMLNEMFPEDNVLRILNREHQDEDHYRGNSTFYSVISLDAGQNKWLNKKVLADDETAFENSVVIREIEE